MKEETTTQFRREGEPAFTDAENDNSADSSSVDSEDTEENNDTDTSTNDESKDESQDDGGEDKENLAKHPRWKEREEDWDRRFNDQEKRHSEELAKIREETQRAIESTAKSKGGDDRDMSDEVPSWFGGDEKQWREYKKHNESLISEAEERARKSLQSENEEKQKAIESATQYMEEQIKIIETDKEINPDGTKVDKNKLLKFVLDNELVDTRGRWNYRAGFAMMQARINNTKSDKLNEKKKIAGATTSDQRAEAKKSNVMTSDDFSNPANRPW